MRPFAAVSLALFLFSASAACGRSDTGIRLVLRLGSLQYDELRLRVVSAGMEGDDEKTLVDPTTNGRYAGPFPAGDQSVIVYVDDELDGVPVACEAGALSAATVVASGAGRVTVERRRIKDLEIVMSSPGAPVPPKGGGGGPPTDPGGATSPGRATGEACSVGSECLTGHCADGVCCESECRMSCRSCALPDTKGLCRPVPMGTPDPRGMCADKGPSSCETNGLCDVSGQCAVYPAGTVCAPPECAEKDKAVVPARTCDGAGKCADQPKVKCPEPSSCAAGVCS